MTATTDGSTGAANLRAAAASDPTESTSAAPDMMAVARHAAERSVEHLLGRQDEQGWWKGDLATNVTMDAEDLLLRQFLGIQDPETVKAAPASSGASNSATVPGTPSTRGLPTSPPPSRRTSRCGWPGTGPTTLI